MAVVSALTIAPQPAASQETQKAGQVGSDFDPIVKQHISILGLVDQEEKRVAENGRARLAVACSVADVNGVRVKLPVVVENVDA